MCRAENTEPPTCRRCRADLTLLWSAEEARARQLQLATSAAAAGQWGEARRQAEAAHALRRDGDSWRLLALTALMLGEHAQAWRCYRAQKVLAEA